jgi:hypothetical protein
MGGRGGTGEHPPAGARLVFRRLGAHPHTNDPYKIAAVALPAAAIGPVVHALYHQPANLRKSLILDSVILGVGALAGLSLCALGGAHNPPYDTPVACMALGTVVGFAAPIYDGLLIAHRRPAVTPVVAPGYVGLAAPF